MRGILLRDFLLSRAAPALATSCSGDVGFESFPFAVGILLAGFTDAEVLSVLFCFGDVGLDCALFASNLGIFESEVDAATLMLSRLVLLPSKIRQRKTLYFYKI